MSCMQCKKARKEERKIARMKPCSRNPDVRMETFANESPKPALQIPLKQDVFHDWCSLPHTAPKQAQRKWSFLHGVPTMETFDREAW